MNKPDVPETYTGYNPKIHGNYDPSAPYAQYHHKKREEEARAEQATVVTTLQAATVADYSITGAFNRFSNRFQSGDQNTERHSDQAKSGRQMDAFFDVQNHFARLFLIFDPYSLSGSVVMSTRGRFE